MSLWWESLRTGNIQFVVLVQFDLKGHSLWVARQSVPRDAARHRSEFASALRGRLAPEGFSVLYWLGDGGVFARKYNGATEDADAAIAAADAAFECFKRFRDEAKGAEQLSLRATATLMEVVLDPDASNWFSPELNDFLKFEREIGLPDAFVITELLYKHLSARTRQRFPGPRRVILPAGQSVTLFTDAEHPFRLRLSSSRFGEWLTEHVQEFPAGDPDRSDAGKLDGDVRIRNVVILDTAPSEAGYAQTVLTPIEYEWLEFSKIMEPFAEKWSPKAEAARKMQGVRAAPLRLWPPLTDNPALEIETAVVDYQMAQPFHELLTEEPRIQTRLAPQAFEFRTRAGRVIPGILGLQVAVLLSGDAGAQHLGPRYLLLAHRAFRKGGYYDNRWSASFEEQFAPVKSTWGGRERNPDKNLVETVVRGLREELLGDDFIKPISVSLHAVFIELENLNVQVLAVVNLPDTSFSEVKEQWLKRKPVDWSEHDALAIMPLEASTLRSAISEYGPEKRIALHSETVPSDRMKDPWHPTSPARIACCLWMVQKGA